MRSSVVALLFLGGCSGGGMTAEGGAVLYSPCAEGTEVGSFSIWVMENPSNSNNGSSVFNGIVWDHAAVSDYRRPLAAEGQCILTMPEPAIACTPTCTGTDACYPDGTCAPNSISQGVGTVKISGLLNGARSFEPYEGDFRVYSSNPGDLPYPAAEPGAAISLRAAGGASAPFMLEGRGFTPLPARAGTQLTVARDQPLALAWDQPAAPVTTRLIAHLYLGGDGKLDGGGILGAGSITCTFPDTGAGTIPASLIGTLIDQGVNAAPLLQLQRETVSSTQIAHGCVSFSVATPSLQPIVVDP